MLHGLGARASGFQVFGHRALVRLRGSAGFGRVLQGCSWGL